MNAQDQADAYLARRIRRATPGGATAKKLAKLQTPRVERIVAAMDAFTADCQAVQDACAINLADAPAGTVRQYIARRGEDRFGLPAYRLFNCNEANATLSEADLHVGQVPMTAREEANALVGQAFNQVQIFGPEYVWKPKK